MWTKIGLCTEAYPTAPCHKPPVKWPRKYNKVKQEKTLAVHFLNEKPDYIEKVNLKMIALILILQLYRTSTARLAAVARPTTKC